MSDGFLHKYFLNNPGKRVHKLLNDFMRSTDFIAFYDSIVVFEKRRQAKRSDLITHSM